MIDRLLEQLRIRDRQMFLLATVCIGVLAGLLAVLFTLSIERLSFFLFGMAPSRERLMLVPPAISLVTGVLLAKYFPDCRGSGVPQTEAAYHLANGRIPGRVPIGKFLTGVLCVGSGHSMGREGPSVQIGAGLASVVGRWLRLSPERIQALVPIGAAAALSAAFNTPVSAVIFALEEIIGDMNAGIIGPAVIASVSSVIVERSILGNHPLFRVPQYHLLKPEELLWYALLGLVGGIISLMFCKGLLWLRRLFARLPRSSVWFQPAIGGLIIGIILIFFPEVMGVGYEYVDQALSGGLALKLLILLCGAKLVATIISYASGNAGGIFAPSLYLGAMAGGAMGTIVHRFAPLSSADPGAYALVGMGTLFAGIIRAPMTSVFMIFELTQDYQILVPLMVANLISFMISRKFQAKPIYHALLEQESIYLPGMEGRLSVSGARAGNMMTQKYVLVSDSVTVGAALDRIKRQETPGDNVLVGPENFPVAWVRREKLEQAALNGASEQPALSLADRAQFAYVYPDQSVDYALQQLSVSAGPLLVRNRSGHRLEGIITRQSVMDFLDRDVRPAMKLDPESVQGVTFEP
ncbi:MAG TPA: chloride channel protein [Candidatus Limnocylindrales bacterium]|nr:chloride channel protein [Candidatus Limnocylindrales bacterium]